MFFIRAMDIILIFFIQNCRICDQAASDIQKIERQKLEMTRKIDDLRKEIMYAKSVVEIKIISEKVLDKKVKCYINNIRLNVI